MVRTSALIVLAAAAAAGCGPEGTALTGAEVSGVVKLKGHPLTGGSVRLVDPADPNKSMGGNILGDGTYTVPNAPTGELVVVVETESAKNDPRKWVAMANAQGGAKVDAPPGPPLKYVPIDKKYTDAATSPLRMTVTRGKNVKDVELN